MANGRAVQNSWDFECPQFVDFVSGLNGSDREDVYFDCEDRESSAFEDCIKDLTTPDPTSKNNRLTKKDENKLMDKMEAALSIIENTPTLGKMKGKEICTVKNFNHQIIKTASKVKAYQLRLSTLHRSRSVAALSKITTNKAIRLRKRSSSLNDLRQNKKHTYPTTPMCLKRTIVKAKSKIIKTSEEMELEEIAKLQKQLIQHLRYNEISLKRLKLRPASAVGSKARNDVKFGNRVLPERPFINQKNIQPKLENFKENKAVERVFNPCMERLNVEKELEKRNPGPRPTIQKLSHAAIKKMAVKMNSIINYKVPSDKAADRIVKGNMPSTSKNTSVASSFVWENNEKGKVQGHKKPVNAMKKYGFHSGLLFADNVKKVTVVKPFSFDKIKDVNATETSAEQKVDTWLSSSVMNLKIGDGKENNHVCRVQPNTIRNVKGGQSSKFDDVKHPSNMKGDNRAINQIRGLPLSENFMRN